MVKHLGLVGGFAVILASVGAGCEETVPPCGSECGCDDGGDCSEPSRGVATPWESFDGELGAAPSGTLLLKLTSGEGFCSDPWVTELACAEDVEWEADIPLPPALQFAGATVELSDLADLGGASIRQTVGKGGGCDIEEEPLSGSLEVVSINEYNVTVRFSNTSPAVVDLEKELTVPRCQNPELPQQAVALGQSLLDSIYVEMISGGAEEDIGAPREPAVTEPLHIFIDVSDPAASAVCTDPRALMAGCDTPRSTMEIVLGLNEQYTGSYQLGEFVTVETRSTELDAEETCIVTTDPWTQGTVEVVAITPQLVHVRVDDGIAVTDAIATRCF